jgi:hypothetical protein
MPHREASWFCNQKLWPRYGFVNVLRIGGVGIAQSVQARRPGFDSRQGKKLFSSSLRPAVLGPTQAPIHCLSGACSLEVKYRGMKLVTYLYLVPTLGIRRPISPLPHTSSWRGASLSTGTTLHLPSTSHWQLRKNICCYLHLYHLTEQDGAAVML